MTKHYHYDENRVFTGMVSDDPAPDGNSAETAPPPIGGQLWRFVDLEHGWEAVQAVDLNGVPLAPVDYFINHPDWVEDVVPMAPRSDEQRLWAFEDNDWWFPDRGRPLASHGEIMLISDQVARLAYKQESDEGQGILRNIHALFPDAPLRENADGVMEAFNPETGEARMCQPGGVRQSFAYEHAQYGLYIFDAVCPDFLIEHYKKQDNSLPRDQCEYPGWWGYKFNIDVGEDETLTPAGSSVKIVSRMPELYDLPDIPPDMTPRLYAWNLPSGNFMDGMADVYFGHDATNDDDVIDAATAWFEAHDITSPYTGGSYSDVAASLYGLTFNKADLSPVKAKFYFFTYDRVLNGIMGELVLQGRADLVGFVTPERPTA